MAHPAITDAELALRFTYHRPNDGQADRYEHIRAAALELARDIVAMTPLSREQGNSLSALDEVVFWANAAIARREPVAPTKALTEWDGTFPLCEFASPTQRRHCELMPGHDGPHQETNRRGKVFTWDGDGHGMVDVTGPDDTEPRFVPGAPS